jgi:hypothetical protein
MLLRSPASTGYAIEQNDQSQCNNVRDRDHIESCGKRTGPVTQDAEHLRAEIAEQAGAETDHTHRIGRLAPRHHAAGKAVQLIGRCEAEADYGRRGYSEHGLVFDRHRRRRYRQQDKNAAEHNQLVEAVGQQSNHEIHNDRGDVSGTDNEAGRPGVEAI